MDYKKSKAPVNTVTRNIMDLCEDTGNIYESVAIIAKRANQISVQIKEDLSKKLAEFASYNDSLEEVFENREQIEISRYYEKLPKPSLLATQEFVEGKIYWRDPPVILSSQQILKESVCHDTAYTNTVSAGSSHSGDGILSGVAFICYPDTGIGHQPVYHLPVQAP